MSVDLNSIKKTCLRFARADVMFWLMPPLIILLIWGTVAQAWMGLYAAHKMFFSSFIFFPPMLPIPLPGGFTLLGLLSIGLTLKFLFASTWSWVKSGIILIHFGALLLLIGGLITAISARESYMVIPEGNQSSFIYDYHQHEFLIYKNDLEIVNVPFKKLDTATFVGLPFTIEVIDTCLNCDITRREETADFDPAKSYLGMAQFMSLSAKPSEKEPEENITGVTFTIDGLDDTETIQNGLYLGFTGMPKPVTLNHNNDTYRIIFGKAQRILPFSITLIDFVKDSYEGTDKARGYHSDIVLTDGDISWPVRIGMNEPLRYQGYTFFQSSFDQTDEAEITILAVVKNQGWLFPYIGTLIIGAGLLIHIAIMLRTRRKKGAKA
jgi:hypothetical protein